MLSQLLLIYQKYRNQHGKENVLQVSCCFLYFDPFTLL